MVMHFFERISNCDVRNYPEMVAAKDYTYIVIEIFQYRSILLQVLEMTFFVEK